MSGLHKALGVIAILAGLTGCGSNEGTKSNKAVPWYGQPAAGASQATQQKAINQFLTQPQLKTKGFKRYGLVH